MLLPKEVLLAQLLSLALVIMKLLTWLRMVQRVELIPWCQCLGRIGVRLYHPFHRVKPPGKLPLKS